MKVKLIARAMVKNSCYLASLDGLITSNPDYAPHFESDKPTISVLILASFLASSALGFIQ